MPPPFTKNRREPAWNGVWNGERWVYPKEFIPKLFRNPEPPKLAQPTSPPKFGLLTHTVVQSPVSHWILPITSAEGEHCDIAFVGDKSIRIRRLDTTGKIWTIWELHNIKTRIRNAKALHSQQWLVLALEDGDLLFVTKLDKISDGIKPSLIRYKPLDRRLAKGFPGSEIATESSSRYVAVACSESLVLVVETNSHYELQLQEIKAEPAQCVRNERLIQIKGVILKVEFLHPPLGDPGLVLLAILASRDGEFWLDVFQWDACEKPWGIERPHGTRGFRLSGLHNDQARQVPQLLIPLDVTIFARPAAFLLVYEDSVTICDGLLDGGFSDQSHSLPYLRPLESYSGSHKPLWVSWYKSLADGDHRYVLVREDGLLHTIGSSGKPRIYDPNITRTFLTGTVTCVAPIYFQKPMENAEEFAYLLYARETGDGGVFKLGEWYFNIASIPNWAPLNDFQCTPATTQPSPPIDEQITVPGKIYGCAGMGRDGHVSELKRKVAAFIRLTIEFEAHTDVTGLWAIHDIKHGECCSTGFLSCKPDILVSTTYSSILLRQSDGTGELQSISQEDTWLDLSSRTLAASFGKAESFQLTTELLVRSNAVLPLPLVSNQQDHISIPSRRTGKVVQAVTSNNEDLLIAVAVEDGQNLMLISFDNSGESPLSIPEPVKFICIPRKPRPTTFAITRIAGTLFIAWECQGDVKVTARGAENSMECHPDAMYTKDDGAPRFRTFSGPGLEAGECVSIGFLSLQDDPLATIILAGYRDGTLCGHRCVANPSDGFLLGSPGDDFRKRLGTSPVQICIDSSNPAIALVSCESSVYRLSYNWMSRHPQLTKVDLTDDFVPSDTGLVPEIIVFNYGKDFLITTGSEIFGVELGDETTGFTSSSHDEPSTSKGISTGPASMMITSEELGGLLVASTMLDEHNCLCPAIVGYKTDGTSVGGLFGFSSQTDDPKIKPEKITCMIEFMTPQTPKTPRQHLVLVGTNHGALALGPWRVGTPEEKALALPLASLNLPAPIHAVLQCPHDANYGYACVGSDLLHIGIGSTCGDGFEIETHPIIALPSRGVAMSHIKLPAHPYHQLTVLTAQHSIVTFDLRKGGPYDIAPEIVGTTVDAEMRNGLDLATFQLADQSVITLVSDKECGVTGLWKGPGMQKSEFPQVFNKLFDAELSASIKRFRLVESRPTWLDERESLAQGDGSLCLEQGEVRDMGEKRLLGIALDGSVTQFLILKEPLWQLLALLQYFAEQVPEMNPGSLAAAKQVDGFDEEASDAMYFYMPPSNEGGQGMHVDGDLIQEWLKRRNLKEWLLEKQMQTKQGKLAMKIKMFVEAMKRFAPEFKVEIREMRGVMGEWKWREGNEEVFGQLVERVYVLLEYLFQPVV